MDPDRFRISSPVVSWPWSVKSRIFERKEKKRKEKKYVQRVLNRSKGKTGLHRKVALRPAPKSWVRSKNGKEGIGSEEQGEHRTLRTQIKQAVFRQKARDHQEEFIIYSSSLSSESSSDSSSLDSLASTEGTGAGEPPPWKRDRLLSSIVI